MSQLIKLTQIQLNWTGFSKVHYVSAVILGFHSECKASIYLPAFTKNEKKQEWTTLERPTCEWLYTPRRRRR